MRERHSTRVSFLERLRDPADRTAWAEFVRSYGKQIYRWCRRWRLQAADAEDVTQIVLTKLIRQLGHFEYDPSRSFRAYLKTLTHRSWCDWLDRYKPVLINGNDAAATRLLANVAQGEHQRWQSAEFDADVLRNAMHHVSQRVEPNTWEAFRLTAIDGLSGADAAMKLQVPIASVFQAKSRVRRMLREIIRQDSRG